MSQKTLQLFIVPVAKPEIRWRQFGELHYPQAGSGDLNAGRFDLKPSVGGISPAGFP
jgi:hypothetical protein